jgi:hypothetical protein
MFSSQNTEPHGLRPAKNNYGWVDAVCIDKTSSAELSEAINSTYKIYWNCARCVAYLADIKRLRTDNVEGITASKWPRSGWTLQDLIAANRLIFYDQD